jgi:hypothetical protein
MGDLHAIINASRDARNIITARWKEREEVEAYSATYHQHPLDYLETTRKRKTEAVEQSTRRKRLLVQRNNSRKPSTGNACAT